MRNTTLLLAAALAAAPVAHAVDFTFRVPVAVTNLPSATQVKVTCTVSRVDVAGVGRFGGGNVVGSGYSFQPVAGGAFSGAVTVAVTAGGIVAPSAARSYRCSLDLYGTATTGVTYDGGPGNMASVVSTATGQTLTEVIATVDGAIPPP